MPTETELKIRVADADADAARAAVEAAGGVFLAEVRQTDTFWDRPDGSLRKADRAVRLRRTELREAGAEPPDPRPLLTCKGPRQPGRMKVRREDQTHVDDAPAVEAALTTAGLTAAMVVQKNRRSYRLGDCRVEIDTLPQIGTFVEIEGPDEPAVEVTRRRLALPGEPTTEPYVALLRAAARRRAAPLDRFTFDDARPA
mgnify:CR=1 FL=1